MTRALVAVVFALMASGCNVASVQEQPSLIPQNKCTTDADCAFGSCDGAQCRTTTGTFDTLLLEITPSADVTPVADGTSIAGVQFIQPIEHVLAKNGTLDVDLDLVVRVSGVVTTAAGGCTPEFINAQGVAYATANSDRSIPALITVSPSSGVLGLFSSPVGVTSALTLANMSSFVFHFNVPPGDYEIYVQPAQQPTSDCPVPPQLLRGHAITAKDTLLNIEIPAPQSFAFHVTWLAGDGALDGWTVDMVDSVSGRAISNSVTLSASRDKTDYVANLAYLPVDGDTVKVEQFIRLSPPGKLVAPTLLFARSGLSLFSANSGTFNGLSALPTPVHVAGAVTARVTPEPLAATVTLVATKINGIDPGILASFTRTVSVGTDGAFNLDVLPGTYRVSAVPAGSANPAAAAFAEANTEWVVGSAPSIQAGKVVELSDTLPINGVALDPSASVRMVGAQVQAIASPASIVTDVLHQALGETTYVPRAASATADSSGAFQLKVDTGTYDFSVQPPSSSGYAWLVIPSVPVGTTPATSAGVGLKTLSLPEPVVYRGNLTAPGTPADMPISVRGALISAYIYMKGGAYTADSAEADSVLQIAETRSDNEGAFTLLIPAAVNPPPVP